MELIIDDNENRDISERGSDGEMQEVTEAGQGWGLRVLRDYVAKCRAEVFVVRIDSSRLSVLITCYSGGTLRAML